MKTYIGTRGPHGAIVTIHDGDRVTGLHMRLDLKSHSPSGYEWGYLGSGPAQLALAILADHLGTENRLAVQLHQLFKMEVIACLQHDAFRLTAHDVSVWVRRALRGRAMVAG